MGNNLINTNKFQFIIFFALCASLFWSTSTLIDDNPKRLLNNRLFDYQQKEDFEILKESPGLGDEQKSDSPDRKEIGPIPDGTFISAYTKEGTGYYDEPYKYKYYSDEPYWVREPYVDRFGYLEYRTVTKYKRQAYWGTGYRQKEYKFVRNFSIYDISDKISLFENRDSAYKRLINEFEAKVSEYKNWKFLPIEVKSETIRENCKNYYKEEIPALSYVTESQDGIKTIRSIYFANEKAYFLEVRANHNTTEQANIFLRNITTSNLSKYNNAVVTKALLFLLFSLILAFYFVYLRNKRTEKLPIVNKHAKSLLRYSFYMTLLNVLLYFFVFYKLFTNADYQFVYYNHSYVDLRALAYLTIATIVFMNLLICTFLYAKQKNEYRYDYLIPDRMQSYYDSRLDSSQEKKALVSMLYYPLFILGPLPLGILCLIYVIPFAIIIFISLEIRHLYRWINKDSNMVIQDKNEFMDYYVVLDLKKESDKDEIEKAFNSAMAKYNSADGNPLYGKQFYYEIQEAYAVLGSTNQLRPEYDKEYEAYKASNSTSYSYSNKQLENEILNIRNKLYKVKSGKSSRNINIIIVSFILLLVITFIILRLSEVIPPLWESDSYSGGSRWSGGDF